MPESPQPAPPVWPVSLPAPSPGVRVAGWRFPDPSPPDLATAWRALPWPGGRQPALVLWVPTHGVAVGGIALSSAFAYSDRIPVLSWPFPATPRVRRELMDVYDAAGRRCWVAWALWTQSGLLGLADPELNGMLPPPTPTRPVLWRAASRLFARSGVRPGRDPAPPAGPGAGCPPA